MDTIRYVFAVILVVWLPPAVVWWYVVHPFVDFWRRFGAKRALWVNIVIALAMAGGLWLVRRTLVGRDLGTHWVLAALGIAFIALALVMGLFRRKQLPTKILSGLPELEPGGRGGRLLTEGVYARVRHPRYLEIVAAVFGYAALANYSGGWIVALAVLPALHLVVLLEERELERRFGAEYEAYRARVPRYLPRRRVDP
jgi:protein-S-isoprenylcysteine O-methyltransferase Ste14